MKKKQLEILDIKNIVIKERNIKDSIKFILNIVKESIS